MKLLSVRHGSESLSLHAAPRLQGPEEKPPAPSLQVPRGVFMGGHCHEPHTVMVWE